jgi:hypothetical protein
MSHTNAPASEQASFPLKNALVLYGISYFFTLLIAKSYFWDDWSIYANRDKPDVSNLLNIKGSAPWRSLIEVTILQASPFLFHIVSFIGFFIASIFLFKILMVTPGIDSRAASAISLLFLLLPVNSARIAMINFSYATCYFFFFAAWYLLCVRKGLIAKFASVLLFFASFAALSSLVFVVVPILHYAYLTYSRKKSLNVKSLVLIFFLLLSPLCYLVCRSAFWPPNDHFDSYNTPQIQGTVRGFIILTLLAIPLCLMCIKAFKRTPVSKSNALIGVGLFSTGVAAFAYQTGGFLVGVSDWMINFVPNYSDWNSRHQLFLPLGISLVIYGILIRKSPATGKQVRNISLWVVVSACVLLNVTFSQEYFLDAKKQSSLISEIATNQDLLEYERILIDDSTVRFNARGRSIRSYEWEGMFVRALGENNWDIRNIQYVDCSDFVPELIVRITSSDGRLKSTLLRKVAISIGIEEINPCGTN